MRSLWLGIQSWATPRFFGGVIEIFLPEMGFKHFTNQNSHFRFVSGVQSLIIVAISTRSVFVCKNIMTDEDPFIHAYIWFGVSYFPYDIVVMYIGYTYQESCRKYHTSHARSFIRFFKKETVMVLHHVIFLVVGLPVSQVSSYVFFLLRDIHV